MKNLMKNSKWKTRRTLLPCQIGIIANCNTIMALLEEIKSEGFDFLLTRKLNQVIMIF